MAISTQPMTFLRFTIDPPPPEFWDDFDEKVREAVFVPRDQVVSSGLVSWDDAFKTEFSYSSYQKGEYIAFQFRVDERKVPANVKKQYMAKELERYRNENDGRNPSRQERHEMSERADVVLLQQAFPVPSFCEIVWSSSQKMLYAGSTNKKMLERLCLFLEEYFNLNPTELPDIILAGFIMQDTPYISQVDALLADGSSEWLGFEFLTWLWYAIETNSIGAITFQDKPVQAALLDRISLTLPANTKEKVLVVTTDPTSLVEARTALLEGKRVYEVSLVVTVGESEYLLTIDYRIWPFKTVKPPKHDASRTSEDVDAKFFEKMFFVEEICGAMDAIFVSFLKKRLVPDEWSALRTSTNEWIQRASAS